jgi:hypothetical protein
MPYSGARGYSRWVNPTRPTPQQVTENYLYVEPPGPQFYQMQVCRTRADWVVIAVCNVLSAGVDVEYVNPRFIIDDLIPAVLTPLSNEQ